MQPCARRACGPGRASDQGARGQIVVREHAPHVEGLEALAGVGVDEEVVAHRASRQGGPGLIDARAWTRAPEDGRDRNAVSRARRERRTGVRALPRRHDVRWADGRGRGAAHDRPCRRPRCQLHRHRRRVHGGTLEAVIGPAIKGARDRWVVATKVAQATGPGVTDRGLSRRHVMRGVDAILARLQTDHIDLDYIHRMDPDTAWERDNAAFGDLIREGKVREWGLSNVRAWHVPHVHHLCRELGVPPPGQRSSPPTTS